MNPKTPEWLQRTENWLWQHDKENNPVYIRFFWHLSRIIFAVVRDVINGHITLHAMSLVYTTLLSIVPLLALSFSVLKGLGAHNDLEPLLRQLMQPLGAQGEDIVTNVLGFVDNIKVGVLGSLGLGVLVFTVISLIQKVERSFNEIWRVTQIRSIGQRFSNYLSVIVIGPVLVVSALGTTATLVGSDIVKELLLIQPFGWLFSLLTRLTPYLMIILLFTFIYIFIPNTKVRLKHALLGGVTAGIIWQSAIFGFTRFVVNSNYEAIYSGFAIGILLLIWLYVAWLILLMGSSVAFYSQHASQITRERLVEPCARLDEQAALEIVYQVARQFDSSGGGMSVADMESELGVGPEVTQRIIERLISARLLCFSGADADCLSPARSLDRISMFELLSVIRNPDADKPPVATNRKEIALITDIIDKSLEQAFAGRTVLGWVRPGALSDNSATGVSATGSPAPDSPASGMPAPVSSNCGQTATVPVHSTP